MRVGRAVGRGHDCNYCVYIAQFVQVFCDRLTQCQLSFCHWFYIAFRALFRILGGRGWVWPTILLSVGGQVGGGGDVGGGGGGGTSFCVEVQRTSTHTCIPLWW